MGKKVAVAKKSKSNISKQKTQKKPKKPKTQETIKRDRLKADLSRYKDRILKAYTRTLPDMVMKNSQIIKGGQKNKNRNQRDIKEVSMKKAIEKFINFQNTYSKRQKQFKLSEIDPVIRLHFWSFVYNLQNYSLQFLSESSQHILMVHHTSIPREDLEIYIKKYLPSSTFSRDNFACKDGVVHIYNLTLLFCVLGLFSMTDKECAEPQRRYLQTQNIIQNPIPFQNNLSIQYGANTTNMTEVDLGENQVERVSQNVILLAIFTFLIITLLCTCIIGFLYLGKFQQEKLAMEERMSNVIQFSLNEILWT